MVERYQPRATIWIGIEKSVQGELQGSESEGEIFYTPHPTPVSLDLAWC